MDRISIVDVSNAFRDVTIAGQSLLADGEFFILQRGSQINGRAFRLLISGGSFLGSGQSGAPLTQDRGYIGWTKREALTELRRIENEYLKK